ncbi:hypothetical protein B0A49_08716 [Cryomyces minteri]|uniref:EVE domain-containing protein n=1 Tax=Cryomyces minteri TaxID=331657 RepID=A0A4U0X0T2_9PEZI|nr:hypothetical protein B0A49_08716 [Cryomyces minteri]
MAPRKRKQIAGDSPETDEIASTTTTRSGRTITTAAASRPHRTTAPNIAVPATKKTKTATGAATNSSSTVKDPGTTPKARGRPAKTAGPDLSTISTSSAAPNAASASNAGTVAAAVGPAFWLMKAESESRNSKGVDNSYTLDELKAQKGPEKWEGVRNLVARDNLKAMKKGDLAFFYASNGKDPGIVGTMEVVEEATPDETAFDASSHYYAKRSTRGSPIWFVVQVVFRSKFKTPIILRDLKRAASTDGPLEGLETVNQPRLSVSKITPGQWDYIINDLAEEEEDEIATKGSKNMDSESKSSAMDVAATGTNTVTSNPTPAAGAPVIAKGGVVATAEISSSASKTAEGVVGEIADALHKAPSKDLSHASSNAPSAKATTTEAAASNAVLGTGSSAPPRASSRTRSVIPGATLKASATAQGPIVEETGEDEL